MTDHASLLQYAIAVPFLAAFLTLWTRALGRPAAQIVAVSGFAIPVILALSAWAVYDPATPGGYAFVSETDTGLGAFGITLHLGLNGVSLPLFVMASIVGLAAGLYAAQSQAEN